MNQKYNLGDSNRWIAFGGSYPGSLAAWLRQKYAHLVHGSISTSGPLLAKVDFREYFDVVVDSLGTYKKDDCVTPVRKAIQQIEVLMKHMIGQRTLNEKYQVTGRKFPNFFFFNFHCLSFAILLKNRSQIHWTSRISTKVLRVILLESFNTIKTTVMEVTSRLMIFATWWQTKQ